MFGTAYVHLGLFKARGLEHEFLVGKAIKNYQAAVAVADRTIGPDFDGYLPWECIDNRPFYRALHGPGHVTGGWGTSIPRAACLLG